MSDISAALKMGIYRHYKGPLYLVIGLAHDAVWEAARTLVVYVPLQLDGAHTGPRMAVRDLDDFTCHVEDPVAVRLQLPDKFRWVPRFEYLGPELTKEMLDGP